MDEDVIRFRRAAARENAHRRGLRRRYSPTLQQQAVEYWQRRRHEDGLRTIAAAPGVAPWTLHRWTRASPDRPRFRPIEVIAPAPAIDPVPMLLAVGERRAADVRRRLGLPRAVAIHIGGSQLAEVFWRKPSALRRPVGKTSSPRCGVPSACPQSKADPV
jgi:hypothetical protein